MQVHPQEYPLLLSNLHQLLNSRQWLHLGISALLLQSKHYYLLLLALRTQAFVSFRNIERMTCAIYTNIRGDKYIVANFYLCTVQHYEIVVGKEIVAYFDVVTIIAIKR